MTKFHTIPKTPETPSPDDCTQPSLQRKSQQMSCLAQENKTKDRNQIPDFREPRSAAFLELRRQIPGGSLRFWRQRSRTQICSTASRPASLPVAGPTRDYFLRHLSSGEWLQRLAKGQRSGRNGHPVLHSGRPRPILNRLPGPTLPA